MAELSEIIQDIHDNIHTNGQNQITGQLLQTTLDGMAVGLSEQVSQLGQEVVFTEYDNLTTESPYYIKYLQDAFVLASNGVITQNQYSQSYRLHLFRVPAGSYRLSTTSASAETLVAISTLSSEDELVVGGVVSSQLMLCSTNTSREVTLNQETLLVLFAIGSKLNNCASIESIARTSVKERIESNEGDISQLKSETSELQEDTALVEYNNLTEESPYYVDKLSDAFIRASNATIERNQYTSNYKLYLFRVPSGSYRLSTTSESSNTVVAIGTLSSEDDFVVGGVLTESLMLCSTDTSIVVDFNTETLLVLFAIGSKLNNCASIEEVVKVPINEQVASNKADIEQLQQEITPFALELTIPDIVYAIVGTELNIWNDAVSLSVDKGLCSPINYQVRWNCTKGLITDRCFRFTPTNEDAGHNYTCTCYLYDMSNNLKDSKQFTIKVLAKNALQVAKNIAYFGDSLGQSAAGQLYADFHNSDKFTGIAPIMVGTRGTTYKYDAVGGYKWLDYATVGRTGYRASVSGVTSISFGAVYTDGVANFEVVEVNIVEGAGNILLQSHYTHHGTLIMPSGTLTKVSGGGDNTVPYTDAFEESANPLWNDTTQQLDAAQYKQLAGLQPTDKIDAVSFQFGVNEAASYNMENILTYIDSLYHCFINDNPNCKFIIGLNTSAGNDVNGAGSNYGATFDWVKYLQYSYAIRQLYMTLQNNADYPNIRIAPINLQVDRYYGYAFGTRPISQRYAENEQYHNNYVHPGTSGYGQMGDAYFAAYIGALTE